MIAILINLLIFLLVVGVIFAVLRLVLGMLGLPAPIVQAIYLILGLIAVIYLISLLAGAAWIPAYRYSR